MVRIRLLPIFLTLALLAIGGGRICAQAKEDDSGAHPQPRHGHKGAVRPMPFPYPSEAEIRVGTSLVGFRAYEQMSRQDRDLAADGESAIGERAGFAGLEFNEGKWAYRQIVCPALPGHLLLQFTRNNGAGDTSMFSASIPRGGDGRVRIIPIVRRGYSLFSPAPINALTISAFNHIRAEEHIEESRDWLGTGLCYAALAGAQPVAAPLAPIDATPKMPIGGPSVLDIPNRGGAVIHFTDIAAARRPMVWTMSFNAKGKLLKATHVPASLERVVAMQPTPVDERGIEMHPAPVNLKGKPIQ